MEMFEVGTGFEPVYTDLQSVASPLGQPTVLGWVCRDPLRADDEARTRDLNLGKVALYQLSYVRLPPASGFPAVEVRQNLSRCSRAAQTWRRVAGVWREWHDACVRAWVNGKVLDDPTGPAVAVSDHGLTVGDGVFEAIKAVGAGRSRWAGTWSGSRQSAEGLGLPAPDLEEVRRGGGGRAQGTSDAAEPDPDHLHGRAGAAGQRAG